MLVNVTAAGAQVHPESHKYRTHLGHDVPNASNRRMTNLRARYTRVAD